MSSSQHHTDYYALLNVSRKATTEEIRASYKKLAVTYHPDVHSGQNQSQELIVAAQEQFTEIKQAYETLVDDKRRMLYDLYGPEGVKSGWELATKYASTEEMLREFEKIKRKQEERDLEGRFERRGTVQLNVSVTDLKDALTGKYNLPEISGMLISQNIKSPVTPSLVATFGASLSSAQGVGRGSINLGLHKNFSNDTVGFAELATTANNAVLQAGMWRRLSKWTTAQLAGVVHQYGNGLTLTVNRQLGDHTTATWAWCVGQDAHMRLGIQHVTKKKVLIDLSTRAMPEDLSVSMTITKPLSKRTEIKISGTAWMNGGAQASIGGIRNINRESKFGCSVSLQLNSIFVILSYHRSGQKFALPIMVTRDLTWQNALQAVLVPTTIALLIKLFVIEPGKRRRKQEKAERLQKDNKEKIEQAKKSAEAAIKLMTHSVTRKQAFEEARKGLIIVQAWYGNLLKEAEGDYDSQDGKSPIIDVTIPLQYLVEDSQLHLQPSSKVNLLGFYDPCPSEEKQLYIRYLFQDKLHQVTIQDWEALAIPRRKDMQQ